MKGTKSRSSTRRQKAREPVGTSCREEERWTGGIWRWGIWLERIHQTPHKTPQRRTALGIADQNLLSPSASADSDPPLDWRQLHWDSILHRKLLVSYISSFFFLLRSTLILLVYHIAICSYFRGFFLKPKKNVLDRTIKFSSCRSIRYIKIIK